MKGEVCSTKCPTIQCSFLRSLLRPNYFNSTLYRLLWSFQSCHKCIEKKVKVKVLVSRVQLCKPMDCSSPGSSVHGILQARILEWIAVPLSRGSSWPRDQTKISWIAGRFFIMLHGLHDMKHLRHHFLKISINIRLKNVVQNYFKVN